jgi:hypothetical protein
MASWSIGKEYEKLVVEVLGSPVKDEYAVWIPVHITIRTGGFSGQFKATFLARDMVKFRDELRTIYESLNGNATFETLERQMHLKVTVDKLGHIYVDGELRDEVCISNKLIFHMDFDQTYLGHTVQELNEVITGISQQVG